MAGIEVAKSEGMGKTATRQNSAGASGSATLIKELLQEIIDGHSDENSSDWNDCGDEKRDCKWCEDAKKIIASLK